MTMTAHDPTGVLTGSVTKGPHTPIERPGKSSEAGVSGALIDIATVDGEPVTSVKADSAGTFRVDLPPGSYKITMPSLYGAMFGRICQPSSIFAPAKRSSSTSISTQGYVEDQ